MVEDNEDTTELSDAQLADRLRKLRGEAPVKPPASPFAGINRTIAPPSLLPDLAEYGLRALDYEITRSEMHEAPVHRLRCTVTHDDMAEEIQRGMTFDLRMHLPAMFPHVPASGEVVCERYDTATREAVFRPVLTVPPSLTLLMGRRDRVQEFARVRHIPTTQWRHVQSLRDLSGYPRGTVLHILDNGFPFTGNALEELLAYATHRGYQMEMVTFGPTSPSMF